MVLVGFPATMVVDQVAEHRTAYSAFERSKRHGGGVVAGESSLVISPRRTVQPQLGPGES
jgi:hypothetical protein